VIGAEVRVRPASINARDVLFGHHLPARHDNRTSQGDLEITLAPVRALRGTRLSVSNEPVVTTAGAFGSESGNLRAKRKTATLHCLRPDAVCPDM
jgi:hypothetical protein